MYRSWYTGPGSWGTADKTECLGNKTADEIQCEQAWKREASSPGKGILPLIYFCVCVNHKPPASQSPSRVGTELSSPRVLKLQADPNPGDCCPPPRGCRLPCPLYRVRRRVAWSCWLSFSCLQDASAEACAVWSKTDWPWGNVCHQWKGMGMFTKRWKYRLLGWFCRQLPTSRRKNVLLHSWGDVNSVFVSAMSSICRYCSAVGL